ncbi:MAG: HD domain-containing protein [Xanthobacteraceae bacterium]|nr:HD domain-containing protein [Xanthobacteraceae bacterium]
MNLAKRSFANRRVLLASDRADRSEDLAAILVKAGEVEQMSTYDMPEDPAGNYAGVVVDIDLSSLSSVQMVRRKLTSKAYEDVPRLFVLSDALHRESTQAWSLGATDTIRWPFDARAIQQRLAMSFPEREEEIEAGVILNDGVSAAQDVLVKIFDKLPAGVPLTFKDISQAEDKILKSLRGSSLRQWLIAINKHHSRTFRHSLFVTGFAVAFAQHLGMRDSDQRRLARAALIHDVGKAFVPAAILDKIEPLTPEEESILSAHARVGFDTLGSQGDFPPEMLDVVLHHHELLNGTGYPEAIAGQEITDIVRMITIIDIFSMLVEERPDSPAMSHADAFAAMENMKDEIDQQILQAFRPIALGV